MNIKNMFLISAFAVMSIANAVDVSSWSTFKEKATDDTTTQIRLTSSISTGDSITIDKDLEICGSSSNITLNVTRSGWTTRSITIGSNGKVTLNNLTLSGRTTAAFFKITQGSQIVLGTNVVLTAKRVGIDYGTENGQFGRIAVTNGIEKLDLAGFFNISNSALKAYATRDQALVWLNPSNIGTESWVDKWFAPADFYINDHQHKDDGTMQLCIYPALNVYNCADSFVANARYIAKTGTSLSEVKSDDGEGASYSSGMTQDDAGIWLDVDSTKGDENYSLWKVKLQGVPERDITKRYYRFIFKSVHGSDSDGETSTNGTLQINQLRFLDSSGNGILTNKAMSLNWTATYPVQINPGEVSMFIQGTQTYDNPIGVESPDLMFNEADIFNQSDPTEEYQCDPGFGDTVNGNHSSSRYKVFNSKTYKSLSGNKLCVCMNGLHTDDGKPANSNSWIDIVMCLPSSITNKISAYQFKTANDHATDCWIVVTTNKTSSGTTYTVKTNNVSRNPAAWAFYGSRDGVNWTLLDEQECQGDLMPTNTFTWGPKYYINEDIDYNVYVSGMTANTFGIAKIESSLTNTLVAVPWTWHSIQYSDAKNIPVKKLVRPTNLDSGDNVYKYSEDMIYSMWSLSGLKFIPYATAVAYDKDGYMGLSNESEDDPILACRSIERGSGIWISRKDVSKPFYLHGQYVERDAIVDILPLSNAVCRTKYTSGMSTIVGNPFLKSIDINDIVFEGTIKDDSYGFADGTNACDTIAVQDADGSYTYMYYSKSKKKWYYTGKETVTIGGVEYNRSKKIYSKQIDAGHAFWYIRRMNGELKAVWKQK